MDANAVGWGFLPRGKLVVNESISLEIKRGPLRGRNAWSSLEQQVRIQRAKGLLFPGLNLPKGRK